VKPFLRRTRYTLNALACTILFLAVGLAIIGAKRRGAERQRETIEFLRSTGWLILYDYQQDAAFRLAPHRTPRPEWWRNLVGTDMLADVTNVKFLENRTPNRLEEDCKLLIRFPALGRIGLRTEREITSRFAYSL
jgi:hypothetical protein